jgi:hypothetical protein
MPIMPPLSARDLELLKEPPRPTKPAALNWCGVIYSTTLGIIEQIIGPSSLDTLSQQRTDLIEKTDGAMNMTIITNAAAAMLRVGMQHHTAVLDALEAVAARRP